MKRTIFILATLLGMTGMSEAVAQTTMSIIPGVSVENFNMNRNGKYLTVTMDIDLSELDVNSNRAVLLTPRLVNGTDSIDLPSIGIYGHRRYYYYIRNGISTISGETEKSFKASNKPEQLSMTTIFPTRTGWTGPHSSSTVATGAAVRRYWRNTTDCWDDTVRRSSPNWYSCSLRPKS